MAHRNFRAIIFSSIFFFALSSNAVGTDCINSWQSIYHGVIRDRTGSVIRKLPVTHGVIVDTNILSRFAHSDRSGPSEAISNRLRKIRRVTMKREGEFRMYIADQTALELGRLPEFPFPAETRRILISTDRNSAEYRSVLATLDKVGVGRTQGSTGDADREILADAIFATTARGEVVTFLTADRGIIIPLCRLLPQCQVSIRTGRLEADFQDGFDVDIPTGDGKTRRIRILPLFGRRSSANMPEAAIVAPKKSELSAAPKSSTYSQKHLALLDDLVARGLIKREEVVNIVEKGDTKKLWRLYSNEGKLTTDEIGVLLSVFKAVEVGKPIGPEKVVEFSPLGAANGVKAKILVQKRFPEQGSDSLALLDPISKKPIAYLDYSKSGDTLSVGFVRVQTRYQNFGYDRVLFEEALKAHPDVKKIEASLSETNFAALASALEEKMPLEMAVKRTPAYKLAARSGFTKANIKTIQGKRYDGSTYIEYSVTFEKP